MKAVPITQGWEEFVKSTEQSANFAVTKDVSTKNKTKAYVPSTVRRKWNVPSKVAITGSRIMEFVKDTAQGSSAALMKGVPTDPFAADFA